MSGASTVALPLLYLWQVSPEPPLANPPYDFFVTIVTGNFGLTIVLLAICFRCLRWVERDLEEYRRRKEREE